MLAHGRASLADDDTTTVITGDIRDVEQQRFFDGPEMVEPGLEHASDRRPDGHPPTDSPVHTLYTGGIGRKPWSRKPWSLRPCRASASGRCGCRRASAP